MNFEQLMMNGWKKEEVKIPEKDDRISKVRQVIRNWKAAFYTDRQALREIAYVLKDSTIEDKLPFPPFVEAGISSPNLRKFTIKFDGGTPCNIPSKGYGIGYGSYQINDYTIVRCDFRVPMSANCAEIMTLVTAIRNVLTLEPERQKIHLEIWGDSTIAVNWANGINPSGRPCRISKGSSEEFRNAVQTLRDILKGFGKVEAQWHSRVNSVKAFGH